MGYQNYIYDITSMSTKIKLIGTLIGLSVAVITIVLNIIAILAICKIRGSLPVNIRLVCCLVTSDLLVSFVVIFDTSIRCIFHFIGEHIFANGTTIDGPTIDVTLPNYYPCFALILHVVRYTGYNGTLLSLTALAMDLFIAIMYPLNYTRVMRKGRVNITIALIFVFALVFGSCILYVPLFNDGPKPSTLPEPNYCFTRWHQQMKSSFVTFGVIMIAIIVVTVVYVTVFYEIKSFHSNAARCPRQPYRYVLSVTNQSVVNSSTIVTNGAVNNSPVISRGTSNSSNMKRNQRGLTTTLVLLLVFLVCFSPSFVIEIYLMIVAGHKLQEYEYVIGLAELLLNLPLICSTLDPLLYSYRLKDIKLSYLRLFCCYSDQNKPTLPPLVAGRARPHHTVQIYHPIHRRSIAGTSPAINPKYPTPWSQRIAKATGIYMERIRKFSSTESNLDGKCRKRTPNSTAAVDSANDLLEIPTNSNNNTTTCYTGSEPMAVKSSLFISAPKMVLCPWQFATNSLRDSWFKDKTCSMSATMTDKSEPVLEKAHKLSNYSSTEYGHSGSIDSANTNSTSMSNSFHHQRSKSIDNSSLRLSGSEKRTIQVEKSILEND